MLLKPVIVIINLVDICLQASSLYQWIPEDTPRTIGSEFSGMKGGQQANAHGRKWLSPAQDKGLLLDPSNNTV